MVGIYFFHFKIFFNFKILVTLKIKRLINENIFTHVITFYYLNGRSYRIFKHDSYKLIFLNNNNLVYKLIIFLIIVC